MDITRDELIAAIEAATRTMTVCTPSADYYRRPGDWREDEIRYVDPQILMQVLKDGA